MTIRRRDFSKYLVHLTRDYEGTDARENLMSILTRKVIEARTPLGSAIARLQHHGCNTKRALASQQVCCFSETPLGDLGGLIDPGVWRRNHFRPYGVVFERATLLLKGANPVWYLNSYNALGVNFTWLVKRFNVLIAETVAAGGDDPDQMAEAFLASPLSELAPFIEQMGTWGNLTKDFSFEREWRHRGDLDFELRDVAAIITPPAEAQRFKNDLLKSVTRQEIEQIEWRPLDPKEVLRE